MNKTLWRVFVALFVISILLVVVSYSKLQRYLDTPLVLPEAGLDITLAKGDTLNKLVYALAAKQRLNYPKLLLIYSRITGRGGVIAAGDYSLPKGITPKELLDKLEKGDVRFYQLTLVEGWTLKQVLANLRSQSKLQQLIPRDVDVINLTMLDIDSDYDNPEGLFFPDTYRFHSDSSDVQLLQQSYRRLHSVLIDEWEKKAGKLPYETPYEALIMASLIEKETGLASEREQISGVFIRRLKKGMRLQTDPSIIYGLGDSFDGNLRTKHLKDSSNPYNTYRHHGLPPTPIALVGREAIHAALHPAEGNTLYFVAKGDGSHYFSETFEEHQKAVKKYQIDHRRKDYSSVPNGK
jgi:UPF0755 protein